ncbi:SanA protein [Nonlabens sp. Hel1_33_55]|uniref:SanA/YdcF family protein n=1 Tax=Nonlabens sp. Hel1_33_55 TaxID=1336802 RepID=UPI000875B92B|nr:ElyC/SanA/YdcF family protein [Nonlabens sp. Hel1_33_55]SCY18357.1 SanA protein [Nonlabens sp. Hel1_33_55]
MKRLLNILVFLVVAGLIAVVFLQVYVNQTAARHITDNMEQLDAAYTGIVLGASVRPDKSLSPILKDRVDAAFQAYKRGKIKKFLLSGDHGQVDYDEVNAMKTYLNNKGVPNSDIFLDHAGFDTYDSMIRAKSIFKVTDAIVFTQKFHLPRAIYLGRNLDLDLKGFAVDPADYEPSSHLIRREWLANVKAWTEIHIEKKPTFEGIAIPITGSSAPTHDQ